MKKQLSFSFLLILLTILLGLLTTTYRVDKPTYQLKLLNLISYQNQMILYPKVINFKPQQTSDFNRHFQKSQYNFYLYLEQGFLQIEGEVVWLKLF